MGNSQPLRIEDESMHSFITSRTINSLLWFVNNKKFEDRVLGYIAKYQQEHEVLLYSVVFQGNHVHMLALFPKENRAAFMRDVNARTAEAVRYTVKEFESGPVFERRYSEQAVVMAQDITDRFFYCALQPVNAGLCQRISEYPGYNSFSDAASQIVREYKVVDWAGYNKAKKCNPDVRVIDFTKYYPLEYTKLSEYEHLNKADYKKILHKRLEEKRVAIIDNKLKKGFQYPDPSFLKKVTPGARPRQTKKDNPFERRPLVFCSDIIRYIETVTWREGVCRLFKKASEAYLAGDEFVEFPARTYKPPCYLAKAPPK